MVVVSVVDVTVDSWWLVSVWILVFVKFLSLLHSLVEIDPLSLLLLLRSICGAGR
jgi:hypothetical protein